MNLPISRHILMAAALAATLQPAALLADGADAQKDAGGIPYHYVGRVKLNFLDSTGVVYGYITALSGVKTFAPLFNGAPSEATAYLTFRADIKFQPLPGNGPLGPGQFAANPIMVEAGTWSIYVTHNPAHQWDDPDTFSNGQTVAVLDRALEQFSVYPTFSINAGAAVVESSTPFTLGGRTINLRDLMPRGVVNITSGSPIPLAGSTQVSPIFGFAGYSLAAGR